VVLPLRDRNPTKRKPFVTIALIAICIAVYFFVQARPGHAEIVQPSSGPPVQIDSSDRFTFEYAAVPCELTQGRPLTLQEISATLRGQQEACNHSARGAELFADKNVWLAVVTSIFLHASLLHLGGNMLFLWVFGNNIEDHMGHIAYLVFYLVAGVVAAAAHIFVQPDSTLPVVGASGSIAGVMGAYLVWFPRAKVTTLFIIVIIPIIASIDAMWLLLFWFASQFFTAADSAVAWVAHVAGFVFGAIVALIVRRSEPARKVVWRGYEGWS
jgi:membrane associated rhomboid family serine protease